MAYTDEQLAAFLRQARVPAGQAAVLVAIAHPESGASDVIQQGQPYATTGWGLWQITPGNSVPAAGTNQALLNPRNNAKAAAAKLRSQGLGAWTTYTSGAYKPYLPAAQVAVGRVYKMPPGQVAQLVSRAEHGTGGGGTPGGIQNAALASFLSPSGSSPLSVLGDAGALMHGTAIVIDRFFGMFAPGNGWRIAFTAGTALAGFGAFRAYTADSADGEGHLPAAIGLTGVALASGFMAFRPWPQTTSGPVKPGAYAVDVLRGEPPPAGPSSLTPGEVQLTEAGLGTLLSLWAAGKTARAVGGLLSGAAGAAGLLGKLKGWIKGGETAAEDAAAAAGDVPAAG